LLKKHRDKRPHLQHLPTVEKEGWTSPLPHPLLLPLVPPTFPTSLSPPSAPPTQCPPSSPKAPVSSPSLSPFTQPFSGRSKEACWLDVSPASSTSVSPHSFRDVVASSHQAQASGPTCSSNSSGGCSRWLADGEIACHSQERGSSSFLDEASAGRSLWALFQLLLREPPRPPLSLPSEVLPLPQGWPPLLQLSSLVSWGGSSQPPRGRKRCLPCTRSLLLPRAHNQRLLQGVALLCGAISLRRARKVTVTMIPRPTTL
jgi:hypothetical protein